MEEIILESASFQFSQEGNCLDGDIEFLEINCQASLGIDREDNCFYTLKTEKWSIESIDDLKDLFERISKIINK